MKIQKMVFSSLLVAIGTILGHLIYIPVGVAKCFPIQHTIKSITGGRVHEEGFNHCRLRF